MTGVTVGTPTYMSPEQCETREVTGASDQYSLGVVAYEMLTGRLPFLGESTMSVMYAHFNQPPRPVTELRPDCPPNLAAAVMRMLEKDPAQRWPSMDDVVAVCGRPSLRHDDPIRREMITLAHGGAQRPGPKTPTSPIALSRVRTRITARRRRWVWPAIAATTAAVALGLWWASPWAPRAKQAGLPNPAIRDSVPVVATRPDSSRAVSLQLPPPAPPTQTPPRRAPITARHPAADSLARLAAQRDDSLIGSLRASALKVQQRAALAGASPADLSGGHAAFASAESLAAARRVSDAMMQYATAASLWADAERGALSRGARDTAPRRVAEAPPPPVAPDPRPDIQSVIADYATALESREIEQVRHTY